MKGSLTKQELLLEIEELRMEIHELRTRLGETEQTLEAIRTGKWMD